MIFKSIRNLFRQNSKMDVKIEIISNDSIKEEDVIIIKTKDLLTLKQKEFFGEWLSPVFPKNKVIVLDNDIQLEIVEKGEK